MQYRVSNLVVFLHPSFGRRWLFNWSSSFRRLIGLVDPVVLKQFDQFLQGRFALVIVVALAVAGCTLSWGSGVSGAGGSCCTVHSCFHCGISTLNRCRLIDDCSVLCSSIQCSICASGNSCVRYSSVRSNIGVLYVRGLINECGVGRDISLS